MTAPRLAPSLLALAAAAIVAACGAEGGRSDYADGDSGQAAPATVIDTSATRGAPDSTAGVSERTRSDAVAGDTTGAKADTSAVRRP